MHTFHQKEAHLREHGFQFVRAIKHGAIWSDGTSFVTVSRSRKHAHEFLKDVRKAVQLREGAARPDLTNVADCAIIGPMNQRRAEHLLKESGFAFHRKATHGSFWTDDTGAIVLLGHDLERNPRNAKNFEATLQRAKRAREAKLLTEETMRNALKPFANAPDLRPSKLPTPRTTATAKLGDLPALQALRTKTILSPNQTPASENRRVLVVPDTPARVATTAKVVRKFDPETRYLLFLRVDDLMRQGEGPTAIVKVLNEEGNKMPGGEPITLGWVTNTVRDIRLGNMAKDPSAPAVATPTAPTPVPTPAPIIPHPSSAPPPVPAPQTPPAAKLPPLAMAIMQDQSLTPDQRLTMLRSYVGLIPHPGMVTAILNESGLTTAQVFKLLETYMNL